VPYNPYIYPKGVAEISLCFTLNKCNFIFT
jgi:hypothetical protein